MSDFVSHLHKLRAFTLGVREGAANNAVAYTSADTNMALRALDAALNAQSQLDRIDELLKRHEKGTLQGGG